MDLVGFEPTTCGSEDRPLNRKEVEETNSTQAPRLKAALPYMIIVCMIDNPCLRCVHRPMVVNFTFSVPAPMVKVRV